MYKLCFYVPLAQAEVVKDAIFSVGAGDIGNYSHCCFETEGTGQFKPNAKANPAVGHSGQIEKVAELKVELVVEDSKIKQVINALIVAHPYEEPAYQVWPVLILDDLE